ncbi:MAG: L,D-transpeptidase family protein, partial [Desulfosarcina sp.]|nr:L,D-transpeptidase family protein [Desulfobacterales bacterium]
GDNRINGETIAAGAALTRLYERRFFKPGWEEPQNIRVMIAAIRAAEDHGLNPAPYHLATLQNLAHRALPAAAAENRHDPNLDILLTDSFLLLAHDLSSGRVNPARINPAWNFDPAKEGITREDLLEAALIDGRIQDRLEEQAPSHPLYRRLKAALEHYRRIAAAGGWAPIPEGPRLEVGVRDVRVPLLRERLMLTGDLSIVPDGNSLVFDPPLARAVLRFQERTRVNRDRSREDDYDGAVGTGTLAALNVPVEAHIRQLRVNLERGRWFLHDLPASFVMVDMAGYRGYLYKDDEIIWRARVQIGAPYRETLSFRSAIKYIVFNPTWTVPPGILRHTTLPRIRKDLSYLDKHHFQVIDREGQRVDPATVEWTRYTAASLPYRIVQTPGPHNALGRVKFIFPNPYYIYLHDTSYKSEFGSNDRTFSSGCIRIDKPFKLAKRLLDGPDKWTIGRIRDIIATEKTRTVFLPEPVPVLLLYLTALVDDQEQVHFRKDVYKRDAAVLKGLDASAPPSSADGRTGQP